MSVCPKTYLDTCIQKKNRVLHTIIASGTALSESSLEFANKYFVDTRQIFLMFDSLSWISTHILWTESKGNQISPIVKVKDLNRQNNTV